MLESGSKRPMDWGSFDIPFLYLQIQWIVYQVMCTLSTSSERVPDTVSTLAAQVTPEKPLTKGEWLSPKAKSIVA
jgi:hypothetical protein